ncbi:hypothetical protein STCU_04905 [Strigomonas culicis]|uniref:Membrane-associated protein n=1 Tax=Strigomonas culicis TaxID=28005 RepID=S9UJ16_9TRYP|nr:hypothetical protein STCU_04905 [Strigomonas culicis]|eukprot:EPY28739.1 hypothetical protein STCU_04905 [Strigomonas culicis]
MSDVHRVRALLVLLAAALLLASAPHVKAACVTGGSSCWQNTITGITYGGMNPGLVTSYGTNGYSSLTLSTKTYNAGVAVCKNAGYLPYTDQVPKVAGTVIFGDSVISSTGSFFIGATADGDAASCTEGTESGSSVGATGWSNNCFYRFLDGFFDMYTYVTPAGASLPGTAFWKGNYMYMYNSGDEASVQSQMLNGFAGFNWAPELAYPLGRLYLAGKVDTTNSQYVARFDTTATPLTATDSSGDDIKGRFPGANTLATLSALCIAQISAYADTGDLSITQPTFVQGWKDLTWLQKYWYVLYILIAGAILGILLAILIICCTKKETVVDPMYPLVLRERVGKAYTYSDSYDDYVPRNPLDGKRQGCGFKTSTPQTQQAAGIYTNSRRGTQHGSYFDDEDEAMMPSARGMDEEPRRLGGGDDAQGTVKGGRHRDSRRSKSRVSTNTFSEVELPQGGEINEESNL